MIKRCHHCGGEGSTPAACAYSDGSTGRYRCDDCDGTGVIDDAEHEPEICPGCEGNGCRACKNTGEVWRKVDSETTEEDE